MSTVDRAVLGGYASSSAASNETYAPGSVAGCVLCMIHCSKAQPMSSGEEENWGLMEWWMQIVVVSLCMSIHKRKHIYHVQEVSATPNTHTALRQPARSHSILPSLERKYPFPLPIVDSADHLPNSLNKMQCRSSRLERGWVVRILQRISIDAMIGMRCFLSHMLPLFHLFSNARLCCPFASARWTQLHNVMRTCASVMMFIIMLCSKDRIQSV